MCSGSADDWRNRERVVLDLLSNFKWDKIDDDRGPVTITRVALAVKTHRRST